MAFQTKALHIYYVMKSQGLGGRGKEENDKYFLFTRFTVPSILHLVRMWHCMCKAKVNLLL